MLCLETYKNCRLFNIFLLILFSLLFVLSLSLSSLGVYTIRFGRFWRSFLHRAYKVWFHPMLDRTSLLEGKNQSTQTVINLGGSVRFIGLYGLDF